MFGNERPRRITKRESRSAILPAIESDPDQSADQQEHDDRHHPADQLEVTDQLSQSYSTLLKSLTEAYQTMFHTHDHEDEDHDWLLDGDRHHHDHDHAEGNHDRHGHDLSEGDADGDEDALSSSNTTPVSRRQPRKNQTSWLGQHLSQNHRHHDHDHHHHRDGHHDHDHGQEEGMTPARTWLSALASMLVISLMGLLAVCCLPLLQGPRFESCKFFLCLYKCSMCAFWYFLLSWRLGTKCMHETIGTLRYRPARLDLHESSTIG